MNRRGYYSDGECNLFVVPEELRFAAVNPVRELRKQLWAELLDLPPGLSALLADPVAASRLFRRTPDAILEFAGAVTLRGRDRGTDAFGILRTSVELVVAVAAATLAAEQEAVFNIVADPSSFLQTVFE